MIVRCCQCEGKMRIDESALPKGQTVKVRCPHCSAVGCMPEVPLTDAAGSGKSGHESEYVSLLPPEPLPPTPAKAEAEFDPDAFRDFRFPAERDAPLPKRTLPVSRTRRLAVWAAISVAVVLLFALLVNLILPGPTGRKQVIHTAPGEERPSSQSPQDPTGGRR